MYKQAEKSEVGVPLKAEKAQSLIKMLRMAEMTFSFRVLKSLTGALWARETDETSKKTQNEGKNHFSKNFPLEKVAQCRKTSKVYLKTIKY